MKINKVKFRFYKALKSLDLKLQDINILTGHNNAGKSTLLSAIRLLDIALSYAKRRNPKQIYTPVGRQYGYPIPTDNISISIENIHTDLLDIDTTVEFHTDDQKILSLYFPISGGCYLYVDGFKIPKSTNTFKKTFPIHIIQVPVLGPLEHDENLVLEQTIQKGLNTHRASRHFRNYWHYHPEDFTKFKTLIESTWPNITMNPPELSMGNKGGVLHMFCEENRRTRELYWCGFGFQIWCQLLSHISRVKADDLLVVDEPETYLHPIVQKQLLSILRETGAQVIMATHSPTIIADSKKGEVIAVDRNKKRGERFEMTGIKLCSKLGLLPNEK